MPEDVLRSARPQGLRARAGLWHARDRVSAVSLTALTVGTTALVLGLVRLGAPSFWVDEAYTANGIQDSFLTSLHENVHWLYYLMLEPWAQVAGSTEWALRAPSVVATTIACILLVVLAGRVLDRAVALLGGLLLATNAFVVQWSQQARSYTIVLALSIGTVLLLLRALERGSQAAWAGYGAAFSVLVVLQPVMALALAPAHLALAFLRRERLTSHALLAPILVAAVGGTWAAMVAVRTQGESGVSWIEAPSADEAARTLASVSGVGGLGVALAVAGVWTLRRAGRSELAVWLAAWAWAPCAVLLLMSFVKPMFVDRYLIASAPAFALLGGVAIAGLAPRKRVAALVVATAATGLALAPWYSRDGTENWRGEDWSAAVEHVRDRAAGAPVIVAPRLARPAAAYYGIAGPAARASGSDQVWLLLWSDEGHDVSEEVRRRLGLSAHRLVERRQFGWRVSAQLWAR